MKGKIQTIVGLLIVGLLVFSSIRGIYKNYFADPDFTVLKSTQMSSPIKDALFWHEEELEKIFFALSAQLSREELLFIEPLYEDLKTTGMVSEQIKTMSEKAVEKMIELDAYAGTAPDVWEIAEENGYPYIFKITITEAYGKKYTHDLTSVKYLFSLYDVSNDSLIWEAESTRLSGFLGEMPDGKKSVSVLKKHLKEAKIIE